MDQSETWRILRNDGRSVHHRCELEEAIAQLQGKIIVVKRELGLRPCYCWALLPPDLCGFCQPQEIQTPGDEAKRQKPEERLTASFGEPAISSDDSLANLGGS